ncbi:nucleotidyltransferase domain-containing protein [Clostridium sp.]|uniref:nucleotidyltransferase domain-containing protein n=1 Tax=Clostridium sp. TaxID=1506 RepID=UPI00262BDD1F|nr:nucleotidyltransferase domain-containing protein [Clostridium sp.]
MFEDFFNELKEYARNTSHIESIIIVGSYDRGTNKKNSDLDIVIITSNKSGMIANQDFTQDFGEVYKQQIEYYGACTSIRVWYKDGKEVEFGIVEPSRISIPLDTGTYKVLSDGYKIIIDKKRYFENLKL